MSGAAVDDEVVVGLVARLDAAAEARLGRSLVLYPLAAGDCGGCWMELAQVRGLARMGLAVQDTPVGADVLLVSGAMVRSLVGPVRRALAAMGRPAWVVALGDCAVDGGVFAGSPAVAGGLAAAVPVDLVIPGCPPAPAVILAGLRTLLAVNG